MENDYLETVKAIKGLAIFLSERVEKENAMMRKAYRKKKIALSRTVGRAFDKWATKITDSREYKNLSERERKRADRMIEEERKFMVERALFCCTIHKITDG